MIEGKTSVTEVSPAPPRQRSLLDSGLWFCLLHWAPSLPSLWRRIWASQKLGGSPNWKSCSGYCLSLQPESIPSQRCVPPLALVSEACPCACVHRHTEPGEQRTGCGVPVCATSTFPQSRPGLRTVGSGEPGSPCHPSRAGQLPRRHLSSSHDAKGRIDSPGLVGCHFFLPLGSSSVQVF